MKTICVYCGSSDKVDQAYLNAAYDTGAVLAQRQLTLVYGAGKTGLMGALADGALQHGGQVIGVIPQQFYTPALAHNALSRLEVVDDMHERKARMAKLSDGFIALPGGYGTFEEFFEVLTWAQIGLHHKPIGLLNIQGYFDPLLALVQHSSRTGFIYDEHVNLFLHAAAPEALLEAMAAYTPPDGLARWVEREAYGNSLTPDVS
jgi:uncharacterized protein (TIGR00730 family)